MAVVIMMGVHGGRCNNDGGAWWQFIYFIYSFVYIAQMQWYNIYKQLSYARTSGHTEGELLTL